VLCSTLRLVGARPAAPRLAGIGRLRETANQIVNRQARYNYVRSLRSGSKCAVRARALPKTREGRTPLETRWSYEVGAPGCRRTKRGGQQATSAFWAAPAPPGSASGLT
jgi:hypothetical protein